MGIISITTLSASKRVNRAPCYRDSFVIHLDLSHLLRLFILRIPVLISSTGSS